MREHPLFQNLQKDAIERMKRRLGIFYFEAELSDEEKQVIKYKQKSEKPIHLINSFWYKIPDNIDLPIPFINLWKKIEEKVQDSSLSETQIGEITGHFWRLYSVYRHGKSYPLVIKQIDMCSDEVIKFWDEQLPILSKALHPYILVNRYVVMPLNRTINYIRGNDD